MLQPEEPEKTKAREPGPRRRKMVEGSGGSAALRISANREEGRAWPRQQRCEMLCAAESRGTPGASYTSAHPSRALLGESRALQATRRRGGPRSRDCCWRRGGARGGRGATEQGEARRLLLPGCKIKRVSSGQVVTRRVAWPRSSSSQAPGRGWLRLPHPPPAPSPVRSSGGLFSPLPGSSGSWAGPPAPRPQH